MIALLHLGQPLEPHDLLTAWSFDPFVILGLVLSAGLYVVGLRRLWKKAGTGSGIRKWEAAAFAGGWTVLAIAMVSPLHRLGEVLFSAHMAQHTLIIGLAAPLLILGRPLVPALFAVPMRWRRAVGDAAHNPTVRAIWLTITMASIAWLLHAVALWVWHLPGPYQTTLTSDFMHSLQHVSFLATALLFWWALIHGRGARMGYGAAILYLFTTAVHTGGLGALLTFSNRPWYPSYAAGSEAWGLTPMEDQQLAGLIMWVPAGLSYVVAALLLLAGWLRESERRAVRWRSGLTAAVVALFMATGCAMEAEHQTYGDANSLTGGNAARGKELIRDYGCSSCHEIEGIRGARQQVGPPLNGIASRMYIAGVLANSPSNMRKWIMDPPAVDPQTAMPDLNVSIQDADDISAYLYTLTE